MDLLTVLYSCGVAGCIMLFGLTVFLAARLLGFIHHCQEKSGNQSLDAARGNTRRPA